VLAGENSLPVDLGVTDGIAEIRFNRPDVLNAINVETARCFRDAVIAAAADDSVRVIVLSAAGRAFIAGGDLGYFRAAGADAPAAATTLIEPIHDAMARLQATPKPVLASLHGAVAGAGMSIALAADLAIAADNTVLNMAYVKVAATPDCSASWTLPRLVGLRKAMEIALLGDNISAQEAGRLGLVNWVVPKENLADETRKVALRLAAAAPLAVQGIKRLLIQGLDASLQEQLDREESAFVKGAGTRDFAEALAAFFERRAPKFEGR
jgi:2-(1,2-epoxy-1,2-dihydrophenyl)acetyl-CoA isomerase